MLRKETVLDDSVGQFLIIKNDGALIHVTVGVQHAGKRLGKHRLSGTGLTYDGNGLIFIKIQRDTADRGQDSTANTKLYVKILDGQ